MELFLSKFQPMHSVLRSHTALTFYLRISEEGAKIFSVSTVEVCRSY